MKPRLHCTDSFPIPLPAEHRFPREKYRVLREALGPLNCFEFPKAPLVPVDILELVHDPTYVRAFLDGTLDAPRQRRIGFPWSAELAARSMASVGATLEAAADALDRGWGGALSGGTHHAFRDFGAGFCVFNDLAVAIRWLRAGARIQRAAVVDLDVHQGDGTAAIFEGDPEVWTLSIHARNNFPFRKQQSREDVELEDSATDGVYLERLAAALPRVVEFRPGIVFYQSGVDALASDRLGRLALTHEGLLERDRLVLTTFRDAGVPIAVTLGGGYAFPIEDSVRAHANTFRLALDLLGTGSYVREELSRLRRRGG